MIDYTQPRRPSPMNVDTPLPPGMAPPNAVARPAPQPMRSHIRDLIQRVRGQVPHQVAPAPQQPMQPQPRSVLRPER